MKILSNNLEFSVSLHNGAVSASEINSSKIKSLKYCKSINEADFYSLNILRQNANEELQRTYIYPERLKRFVLGTEIWENTDEIWQKMNYIRETFPEDFI